jgi:hypothetical protein
MIVQVLFTHNKGKPVAIKVVDMKKINDNVLRAMLTQ